MDRCPASVRPHSRLGNLLRRLLGQILHRAVESEHYVIDRNPVKGRSGIRLRTRGKPPREHLEADETLSLIYAADLLDQGTSPIALQRAAQIKARRAAGFRWDDIAAEFEIPQATAIYQSRSCANPVASRRRRALIVVLAFTGVRASELVDLTWGRLDHTHGRIVLNDAKAAAGVREIYLSPFVRKELELYRHSIPEPQPESDGPARDQRDGLIENHPVAG
jgi:integrase